MASEAQAQKLTDDGWRQSKADSLWRNDRFGGAYTTERALERIGSKDGGKTMPPLLSCEDPDVGLYIHQQHGNFPGTTVLRQEVGGEEVYYVAAQDFMEVQRERDKYRRTLALLNAWRISRHRKESVLRSLLHEAGFDDVQAEVMAELIREVVG